MRRAGYIGNNHSRPIWIDDRGVVHRDRRRSEAPRDQKLNWVYRAYRMCEAYANPIRGQMPLSTTEIDAVKAAARILRKGH